MSKNETVEELLQQLSTADPESGEVEELYEKVIGYGEAAVRPLSVAITKSEDACIRTDAAELLGMIGGDDVETALVKGVSDTEATVALTAISALAKLGLLEKEHVKNTAVKRLTLMSSKTSEIELALASAEEHGLQLPSGSGDTLNVELLRIAAKIEEQTARFEKMAKKADKIKGVDERIHFWKEKLWFDPNAPTGAVLREIFELSGGKEKQLIIEQAQQDDAVKAAAAIQVLGEKCEDGDEDAVNAILERLRKKPSDKWGLYTIRVGLIALGDLKAGKALRQVIAHKFIHSAHEEEKRNFGYRKARAYALKRMLPGKQEPEDLGVVIIRALLEENKEFREEAKQALFRTVEENKDEVYGGKRREYAGLIAGCFYSIDDEVCDWARAHVKELLQGVIPEKFVETYFDDGKNKRLKQQIRKLFDEMLSDPSSDHSLKTLFRMSSTFSESSSREDRVIAKKAATVAKNLVKNNGQAFAEKFSTEIAKLVVLDDEMPGIVGRAFYNSPNAIETLMRCALGYRKLLEWDVDETEKKRFLSAFDATGPNGQKVLRRLLKSTDNGDRRVGLAFAAENSSPLLIPSLVCYIKNANDSWASDPKQFYEVLSTLPKKEVRAQLAEVRKLIKSRMRYSRLYGARLLGDLKDRKSIPDLIALLGKKNTDNDVAEAVFNALTGMREAVVGGKRHAHQVLEALNNSRSAKFQANAAKLAGLLEYDEAVPDLLNKIENSDDYGVMGESLKAVFRIRGKAIMNEPRVKAYIKEALDPDEELGDLKGVLGVIVEHGILELVPDMLAYIQKNPVDIVEETLYEMGEPVVPLVHKAFFEGKLDYDTAQRLLEGLAHHATEENGVVSNSEKPGDVRRSIADLILKAPVFDKVAMDEAPREKMKA